MVDWIKPGLALMLAGLVAACSQTPRWPALDGYCPEPVAATALLQVSGDQGRQNLVAHREQRGQQITYAVLDAIGAPQFRAHQTPTGFTVEQSPLYRGVDPEWLLWGWQWWQLRDSLAPVCVESAGLAVQALPETGGWQLTRHGRTVWRWQPDQIHQYELPEQRARVTVREAEVTLE